MLEEEEEEDEVDAQHVVFSLDYPDFCGEEGSIESFHHYITLFKKENNLIM